MTSRLTIAVVAAALALPAAAESFDCVMDPAVIVSVGSPVSGLIDSVDISRGQRVRREQIIATLDADMEDAAIELYVLQAESAQEIALYQVRLDLATSHRERVAKLVERGVATAEQMDEARASFDVAQQELELAQLRQRVLGLELARARTAREQRVIRSPIDGIVVERTMFRGEFVDPDSHVAIIAQLDPLHVEAFLPVELYPEVRTGMTATVRPNAPIGGTYEAEVVVVDQVFDPASATFGVRLSLANPDAVLPAGHRCEVDFGAP
ncbi:efflux RND transporter periplasmic adaptor subunit [Fluviibacterium sp. DFM31]|uniref:Efflux RND transporter periplasmic adaptor subunit n=1 Tax=Meridianimarinicoccus marinus TaxID=3231483 RepID=A0ABV3L3Q1_9RHOB